MPAGFNTLHGFGHTRVTSQGLRNMEPNGTQLYKVVTCYPYVYAGVAYAQGATIPYDANTNTTYSNHSQLHRDFVSGWLDPVD